MLEEKWYIRFIKWLMEKVEELVDRFGLRTCIMGAVVLFCVAQVFICLWNLETDVTITPIIKEQNVLQEDRKVEVTRTAKMNEGMSIWTLSMDAITALDSEMEIISFFNELAETCDNVSESKETVILPKGAGETLFADIGIYTWVEKGKFVLSDKEFSEAHVVMFYGGNYIEAFLYSSERIKIDAGIEMGSY